MLTKYIFVVGGVLSGLGKGILTASIGKLLQLHGYSVTAIKIDPYLNFDAGTMRPTEHGEVWVTEDGGEIDQDLGNYERFLDITLHKNHNITSGKVLWSVLEKERKGEYLGKTVMYIPHVIEEICNQIKAIGEEEKTDFVLVEIGGVVGDYENILFLKAASQLENTLFVLVGYLPVPKHLGEMKSKPMQHAVSALGSLGIKPDILVGRSEKPLDKERIEKIALSCGIPKNKIFSDPDLEIIYELPLCLANQGLDKAILEHFKLREKTNAFKQWQEIINKIRALKTEIKVGIIGKYFDIGAFSLVDSYISVIEAVKHAAWANNCKPKIIWIDSKEFEKNPATLKKLKEIDCVIVPGGFGKTGIEGKILTAKFCRENKIPYLGLCLGLQIAVIEFARNVCGLKRANSTEFDPQTPHPVIDIIEEQKKILAEKGYGATMRLGAWPAILKEGTLAYQLYRKKKVFERHRHRYEVNPKYIKILEKKGFVFSGCSPDGILMEFGELPKKNHPFFIGTQAHPEFTSRLTKPNPLFDGLIKAGLGKI